MCNILGETKNAIKYFNKAIEINPENAQAYNNLVIDFKNRVNIKNQLRHIVKRFKLIQTFIKFMKILEMFSELKKILKKL